MKAIYDRAVAALTNSADKEHQAIGAGLRQFIREMPKAQSQASKIVAAMDIDAAAPKEDVAQPERSTAPASKPASPLGKGTDRRGEGAPLPERPPEVRLEDMDLSGADPALRAFAKEMIAQDRQHKPQMADRRVKAELESIERASKQRMALEKHQREAAAAKAAPLAPNHGRAAQSPPRAAPREPGLKDPAEVLREIRKNRDKDRGGPPR